MTEHRQRMTVAARPEPVSFDPQTTALVVVDMQNDFGSSGGMFDRAGIDIACIRDVIPHIQCALDAARRNGMRVVYLKMGFEPGLADAGPPGSPNRVVHARLGVSEHGDILVRDTWGTDIIDELTPLADDVVLYKTRYSGFFGTNLNELLRSAGVTHLIVVGCTTSVCVESTVRDAFFRDYHCMVLADCCAEPIGAGAARTNHDATLDVIQTLFGSVSSSRALLEVAPQ